MCRGPDAWLRPARGNAASDAASACRIFRRVVKDRSPSVEAQVRRRVRIIAYCGATWTPPIAAAYLLLTMASYWQSSIAHFASCLPMTPYLRIESLSVSYG